MPRGRKPAHETDTSGGNNPNRRLQFTEYPRGRYTGPRPDLPELQGGWNEETEKWWDSISHMPHVVDWEDGDWEYAIATAVIHHRIMSTGSPHAQWFAELRQREHRMGTTMAGRLDLRIRYVNPESGLDEMHPDERNNVENPVTKLDEYRELYG